MNKSILIKYERVCVWFMIYAINCKKKHERPCVNYSNKKKIKNKHTALLPTFINSSRLGGTWNSFPQIRQTPREWKWQSACSLQHIWPRRARQPRLAVHSVLIWCHGERWAAMIVQLWHIIFSSIPTAGLIPDKFRLDLCCLNRSLHLHLEPIKYHRASGPERIEFEKK